MQVKKRTVVIGVVYIVIALALLGCVIFIAPLREYVVDVLDALKTQYKYEISVALTIILTIISVLLCLPLQPAILLGGYTLDMALSFGVCSVSILIGCIICYFISFNNNKVYKLFYSFNGKFSKRAETEGFVYVFLYGYSGRRSVGTLIMSLSSINKKWNTLYLFFSVIPQTLVFSYFGCEVDDFTVMVLDKKITMKIIAFLLVMVIAIIFYIVGVFTMHLVERSIENNIENKSFATSEHSDTINNSSNSIEIELSEQVKND